MIARIVSCGSLLLRDNKNDVEPFLEQRFSSYLSDMARNGTWGDELTLVRSQALFMSAIARLLNVAVPSLALLHLAPNTFPGQMTCHALHLITDSVGSRTVVI